MRQIHPRPVKLRLIAEDDRGMSRSEAVIIYELRGPDVDRSADWKAAIKKLSDQMAAQLHYEFEYGE